MAEFVKVAELEALPPGRALTVQVGRCRIALYNVEGRVFATADACADQGYSLGTHGKLEGAVVTCGFHYWQYDVRTGDSVDGMDEHLETYPVEVRGGEVWVRLPGAAAEAGAGAFEV